MIIKGECKFCKRPLELKVDDDYAELRGDPMKIMRLASCNRCSDLRSRQRRTEKAIEMLSGSLLCFPSQDEKASIREGLCRTTKILLRIACEWYHAEGVAWEEAIVDQIMSHPEKLSVVTARIWQMARNASQGRLV